MTMGGGIKSYVRIESVHKSFKYLIGALRDSSKSKRNLEKGFSSHDDEIRFFLFLEFL